MRTLGARPTWFLLALSLAVGVVALPTPSALASEPRVVVAGSSPLASGDVVVPRTITSSFDLALVQPHANALKAFIADLSNPSSPSFRQYLTPQQFAHRFGATKATVAKVRAYFNANGLQVGSLSKGGILLHVRGTTGEIARAFATPVHTVRRSDGVLASQFVRPATLPSSIAHEIIGVAGLSSVTPRTGALVASHMNAHVATAGSCPAAGSSNGTTPNSLGGYTVTQQAQLYGLDAAWAQGNTGVGQTIGVYELGTLSSGDVANFFQCYGVSPTVTTKLVDGGAPGGFNNEATMDTEAAGALAPGATILVYTGPNSGAGPTDVYQQMADDNTASVITTSWGTCESDPSGDPASEQPIFEQMAAQGQTVISASGDTGSSDCHGVTTNAPAVDDPASQPYVTSIGGLSVTSTNPLSQHVWNDSNGAGGGGASAVWSRPSWQANAGNPDITTRMVPDLSVMGDPSTGFIQYFTGTGSGFCYHSCVSGWDSIGGTSIGAPLVSALVAVGAQSCGVSRLGFLNPALYAMASTGFVDVTSGSNDLYNVGKYATLSGYDMASGLGSPMPGTFLAGLCPPKISVTNSTFKSASATTLTSATATVTLTLRNASNGPVANGVVVVDATAATGNVAIDSPIASATGASASTQITTNNSGVATFNLGATAAGIVALSASINGQTLSTNVTFVKSSTNGKVPGRATIAKLVALANGLQIKVKAPTSAGSSAISGYQYSLNGGQTWAKFPSESTTVSVKHLSKKKRYSVVVRAVNAVGVGMASVAKSITTR